MASSDWDKATVAYNRFAEYTRLFAESALASNEARLVAAAVAAGGPVRCLDLACGTGAATLAGIRFLSNKGLACHMTATDFSPAMAAATKAAYETGVAAEFPTSTLTTEVQDAQDLSSIASESIDIVTMAFGLMFLPDPVKGLSEIRRVLKPSGIALVVTWHYISFADFAPQCALELGNIKDLSSGTHLRFLSFGQEQTMRRHLSAAGFAVRPGTALDGAGDAVTFSSQQRAAEALTAEEMLSLLSSNPVPSSVGPFDPDRTIQFLSTHYLGRRAEPKTEGQGGVEFLLKGTSLVTAISPRC